MATVTGMTADAITALIEDAKNLFTGPIYDGKTFSQALGDVNTQLTTVQSDAGTAATNANQAIQQATDALTAAQAAQATADGAIRTYYQEDPPWADNSTQPDTSLGDLWYKESTGQAYRWNGTTWNLIEDNQIATALAAAQKALTTATGKLTAYYQTDQPTLTDHPDLSMPSIWYDTDDGNHPYYLVSIDPLNWTSIQDAKVQTLSDAMDELNNETLPELNTNLTQARSDISDLQSSSSEYASDIQNLNSSLDTLNNTTIPNLNAALSQNSDDITANQTAINTLNNTTIPSINTAVSNAQSDINTLKNTTLPALTTRVGTAETAISDTQSDISAAQTAINTLNNTTIPGINTAVSDAQSDVNTLKNTTLPGLQDDLDDANTAVTALQDKFPVKGSDMAANTITANQIAADTITASQIATGAITSSELAANSVIAGKIATGAVTAGTVAADVITATQIQAGAVGVDELAANAVTAAKIAANTITASQIAADTITSAQIAASAITSSELSSNSIIAGKIATGAVTAGTIAADVVTATEIKSGSIGTDELAANAVTAAKIAANTITASQIAANTITASQIASETITATQIATNTITASQINTAAITADELAANAVTSAKILAGAVTTAAMTANTINGDRILTNTLDASKITANTITAAQIQTGSITTSSLMVTDLDNLITLGDCQTDTARAAFPTTSTATTWLDGGGPAGTGDWALRFNATTTDYQAATIGDPIPVKPGDSFKVSWDQKRNTANAKVTLSFKGVGTDGTTTGITNASDIRPWESSSDSKIPSPTVTDSVWATYGGIMTVPAGVYMLTPQVKLTGTTDLTGSWDFDNFQMYRAADASLIVNGSITGEKILADSITANEIDFSTLSGQTIVGADILTAASGPRIELSNTNGLAFWSNSVHENEPGSLGAGVNEEGDASLALFAPKSNTNYLRPSLTMQTSTSQDVNQVWLDSGSQNSDEDGNANIQLFSTGRVEMSANNGAGNAGIHLTSDEISLRDNQGLSGAGVYIGNSSGEAGGVTIDAPNGFVINSPNSTANSLSINNDLDVLGAFSWAGGPSKYGKGSLATSVTQTLGNDSVLIELIITSTGPNDMFFVQGVMDVTAATGTLGCIIRVDGTNHSSSTFSAASGTRMPVSQSDVLTGLSAGGHSVQLVANGSTATIGGAGRTSLVFFRLV